MRPRTSSRHIALFGALLALGLIGLSLLPAAAPVARKTMSREEQIANVKRQIAELEKKLAELEKTSPFPDPWVKALSWRAIGPASMGGRIVALAVCESDPSTYWIATASGGLLKTTNNGTTFSHQFDREVTVSIGDVAVAPSNKNIVWVGTGENNPRNSVSYGDGVYKSIDGGQKWTNMGLNKTFQIGRVVIHPKNPDIVYVGALGRLYGPSEERGLYKTTDGGKTWAKTPLPVDNHTGVIEVQMHPNDPETLLVATWQRQRDGFDSHAGALAAGRGRVDPPLEDGYDAYDPARKWGKGGGIFKTTDGGKTWRKLTAGLPTCEMGRIGIDYYRKNPNVVYAIIDTEKIGQGNVPGYLGIATNNTMAGISIVQLADNSPAQKAGLKVGDIITRIDKVNVKTPAQFSQIVQKTKPEQKLSIGFTREGKTMTVVVTLAERPEVAEARRPQIGINGEETPAGVRVTNVLPKGAASVAGVLVGDVIVSIGKKPVKTLAQLRDVLGGIKSGARVEILVMRGKEKKDLALNMPRPPLRRTGRAYAFWYGGQRENVQDAQGPEGKEYGGVYRSDDGGENWKRINSVNPRPMYFSQVRVDPADERFIYVLGIRMYRSTDGGKTFSMGGDAGVHADHHAMWINPKDGRHVLLGTDGGTYATYDRCEKWDYLNTTAIGQFYHVAVDSRRPYRVYGGMQDNGSWGGPSHTLDGRGPVNTDWAMVQGGDGFVCRVDPNDPDIVYSESQEGNLARHNIKTGQGTSIKPRARQGQPPYRFNWNTPFILSQHNSRIVYVGGNHVFRSVSRGNDPKVISPDLTRSAKGSASAIAESPRNPDVLWAGTDDGNLWVTRDGGKQWTNIIAKVGLPKPFWVATIEPSRFVEGRCYVCFDGHRNDDDAPYIYVTENFGETWKPLQNGLPVGSSRCLREDLFNPDVLYLGTEFAVWASIDRGATWTKINNNLPTVAIHELAQHPTAGEMVAATHGRSLWILDVTPLRQLKPGMNKAAATLLAPNTVINWRREPPRGTVYGSGHRDFYGENPAAGARIYYAQATKAKTLELTVQDFMGKTVAKLQPKNEPGLHRLTWNMILGGGPRGARIAPAGQYRVVLKADDKEYAQPLKIENDPTLPPPEATTEEPLPVKKRLLADD